MKGLDGLLQAVRGRRILVIGDVMLDHYYFGDATRISPEAPVPVVNVSREADTVGGAANVAANLASLGGSPEVIGAIGADANGRKLEEKLERAGIRFDPALRLTGVPTITKTRVLARQQQLCRLDFEAKRSEYARLTQSEETWAVIDRKIAESEGVILSDYGKGVLSTPFIQRAAAAARRHGKFVAADPKPSSGNEYLDLDLITPNLKEAIELAGLPGVDALEEIDRVCGAIRQRFRPKHLVVTLGPDGMAISGPADRTVQRIPTAARKVYDVSGAGDTAIAALVLALASGASLADAANFSNAAAGVVVGKLGTATVTPDELRAHAHGSE